MTIEQFLNKLPTSVIKNGKIIDVRNDLKELIKVKKKQKNFSYFRLYFLIILLYKNTTSSSNSHQHQQITIIDKTSLNNKYYYYRLAVLNLKNY